MTWRLDGSSGRVHEALSSNPNITEKRKSALKKMI
jgi:hypothetical protein